jgi:hypothetical protein
MLVTVSQDPHEGMLCQTLWHAEASALQHLSLLKQVVEELVGYLQAARMLAAAAAKAQPPTEELAALAPNGAAPSGAAPQAPQEMDIDGAPMLPADTALLCCCSSFPVHMWSNHARLYWTYLAAQYLTDHHSAWPTKLPLTFMSR